MEASGQLHALTALPVGKNLDTVEHFVEGKNLLPLTGFESCIVHPVAQSLSRRPCSIQTGT